MTVFQIYYRIILEFLVELFVFYVLTFKVLARRDKFALRLTASIIMILAFAYVASFAYFYIGDTIPGRIGVYVCLFTITVLLGYFCFNESFFTVLLCATLSYVAQNFVYKVFLIFFEAGKYFDLYKNWGEFYGVFYRLIYYPYYALSTFAIYRVVIRRVGKRLENREYNPVVFALSLVALTVTIIFSSVEDISFNALVPGDQSFYRVELLLMREAGTVFSITLLAATICLILATVRHRDMQQELEYLQHAIDQGRWQYEMNKDIVDMINIKCHDIKYRISTLASSGKIAEEAIKDLNESISIYDSNTDTGNRLLNVLFSEKRLYCEQNGIMFSCMADGKLLNFIGDGDLYSLFGNIIDNALEAVSKVTDKDKRVINLIIKKRNDMILIQEENYFEGEIVFENGIPKTTKDDKNYHGFGTRSIKMIVNNYGGETACYVEGDVYHLNIIFSPQG